MKISFSDGRKLTVDREDGTEPTVSDCLGIIDLVVQVRIILSISIDIKSIGVGELNSRTSTLISLSVQGEEFETNLGGKWSDRDSRFASELGNFLDRRRSHI